jgi:hypothetical protein
MPSAYVGSILTANPGGWVDEVVNINVTSTNVVSTTVTGHQYAWLVTLSSAPSAPYNGWQRGDMYVTLDSNWYNNGWTNGIPPHYSIINVSNNVLTVVGDYSFTGNWTGNITTAPTTGSAIITRPRLQRKFQWYRGTTAIPGATSAVYTLSSIDAGQSISFKETAFAWNTPEITTTISSTPIDVVANADASNLVFQDNLAYLGSFKAGAEIPYPNPRPDYDIRALSINPVGYNGNATMFLNGSSNSKWLGEFQIAPVKNSSEYTVLNNAPIVRTTNMVDPTEGQLYSSGMYGNVDNSVFGSLVIPSTNKMLVSAVNFSTYNTTALFWRRPSNLSVTNQVETPFMVLDTTAAGAGTNPRWTSGFMCYIPSTPVNGVNYQTVFGGSNILSGIAGLDIPSNQSYGPSVIAWNYNDIDSTISKSNSGSVQAAGSTQLTLASTASSTNDFYNKHYLYITSGPGTGYTVKITGYNGSTKVATIESASGSVTPWLYANILSATKTSPARIRISSAYVNNRAGIKISSVGGMTQLNGNTYYVKYISGTDQYSDCDLYTDNSLSTPVNATGFGTYTSGGIADGTPTSGSTYLTYPILSGRQLVGYSADKQLEKFLEGTITPVWSQNSAPRGMCIPDGTRSLLFFGIGDDSKNIFSPANRIADQKNYGPIGYDPLSKNYGAGPRTPSVSLRVWAYDLDELAEVYQNVKNYSDVKPYGVFTFQLPNALTDQPISSANYDPATRRIYLATGLGPQGAAVIHSFQVTNATAINSLIITTASIPPAITNSSYGNFSFSVAGTQTPTWSIVNGTQSGSNWTGGGLPSGMQLSSSGVLSGTPTAGGSFSFTIRVSDGVSTDATQMYTFSVNTLSAGSYKVILDDWSTGSAVEKGIITLNVDNGPITLEQADIISHYGSNGIRSWRSNTSIIHGPAGEQFEFGAILFKVPGGAIDGSELVQVLVGCKPFGRWASYPFKKDFNKLTDVTHPAPFKIRILNENNILVKTIEMRDGLPINSPQLSQSGSKLGFEVRAIELSNPFSVTQGSTMIKVTHTNHGLNDGSLVYFYSKDLNYVPGANADIAGVPKNKFYAGYAQIIDANNYEFFQDWEAFPAKFTVDGAGGAILAEYPLLGSEGINSPPLRPFFNCGMLLPWQNKSPKAAAHARTKLPQFDLSSWRPSIGSDLGFTNAAIPMLSRGSDGRVQGNGYENWRYALKWPSNQAWGYNYWQTEIRKAIPENGKPAGITDPWISWASNLAARFLATGWGYEPGATGQHTWYTGPGGSRIDRWQIPTPVAYYLSEPNPEQTYSFNNGVNVVKFGRHLVDQTPMKEMAENWGLNYFNHSCHYLTNVKTFETIINTKERAWDTVHANSYYGGADAYTGDTTGDRTVDLVGIRSGTADTGPISKPEFSPRPPSQYYDKYGLAGQRRFWNGWIMDAEHCHQQPGIFSYALGSPMHMVATRHMANAHSMSGLSTINPINFWPAANSQNGITSPFMQSVTSNFTKVPLFSDFPLIPGLGFYRDNAYRLSRLLWLTLNANSHSSKAFGMPLSLIDELWAAEFTACADNHVTPIRQLATGTHPSYSGVVSPWHKAFLGFGCTVFTFPETISGRKAFYQIGANLNPVAMYLPQVLVIMKMTGVWDYLRNHSTYGAKATTCLDFWFELSCRNSVDFMADSDGYFDYTRNQDHYTAAGCTITRGIGYYSMPAITSGDHTSASYTTADTPFTWADVKDNFSAARVGANAVPFKGENWVKKPTANGAGEHPLYPIADGTNIIRMQFSNAVKDWFDVNYVKTFYGNDAGLTKVNSAISKYDAIIADKVADLNTAAPTDYYGQISKDFQYLMLPAWKIRNPTVVASNSSWPT